MLLRRLSTWFGLEWSLLVGRKARRQRKKVLLCCERLEDRTVPTNITWTGSAGDSLWNTAGNWDLNHVPAPGDDVAIPSTNVNGTTAISLTGVNATINSLTSSLPVNVQTVLLTLTGGLSVNNNATLTISAAADLDITTNNQTFSSTDDSGGIVFGDLNASNAITLEGGRTLTMAAGFTIAGRSDTSTNGVLDGGGTFVNQGTIESLGGGTLALDSNITNTGTIEAANPSGAGMSLVNLNGAISNAGGQITVADASSQIDQNGIAISSGTITNSGGKFLVSSSSNNVLGGLTVNGNLDLTQVGIERIFGGLTLDGTISINIGGTLSFQDTQTLTGNATIVFGASGGIPGVNRLSVDNGSGGTTTLTLDTHVLIDGGVGAITTSAFAGNGAEKLVNNGAIQSDVASGSLAVQVNSGAADAISNSGTLAALGGGTLSINSNVTNNGTIQAAGGATVNLNTPVVNTNAQITVNGAGSQIIQNGAAITGGTITNTAGKFTVTGSTNDALVGLTVNGNLDLTSPGVERIFAGLTLNGTATIDKGGILAFQDTQTLTGNATILFGALPGSGGNRLSVDNGSGGVQTLTLGSKVQVHGTQGAITTSAFAGNGAEKLVNQGAIQADVMGGGITVHLNSGDADAINNTGTLAALNGSTLNINSNVTNTGTIESASTGAGTSVVNLDASVTNTSALITVADAHSQISQNGISIGGGTITNAGGEFLVVNSSGNILNGVMVNGNLDLSNTGVERVFGGLTLNGTATIDQGGVLSFQDSQTLSGNAVILFGGNGNNRLSVDNGSGGLQTLTLTSSVQAHGAHGAITTSVFAGNGAEKLVNQGTIQADVAAGSITVQLNSNDADAINNAGILSALNGSTLNINSNVTNTRTIQAANSGSGTSLINLNASITNTAAEIIVADAHSQISQNGIGIGGGSVTNVGGEFFVANSSGNILNGVTVNGSLDLSNSGVERVFNNLMLNGTATIDQGGVLSFQDSQTLSGNVVILFGGNGNNRLSVDNGSGGVQTLTLGSNVQVHGTNGAITTSVFAGNGAEKLVNQGSIQADVSGGSITVHLNSNDADAITNAGTLAALNGETLNINSNVTNTGTIKSANSGSESSLINLDASITNTGGQITVADANSRISQNGIGIGGGTITNAGGEFFVANSGGNVLNGVTVNGNLDLSNTGVERVFGGLPLDGTATIDQGGVLSFQDSQTLSGNAVILFGGNGNNRLSVDNGSGGVQTLTIGSSVQVHGTNGAITTSVFAGNGAEKLVNQGSIQSDVMGGNITVQLNSGNPDAISNAGTLAALNGGTLTVNSNVHNAGTFSTGGTGPGTSLLTLNASFDNYGGGTLTGGSYLIANPSGGGTGMFRFAGFNPLGILTNAATIVLDGPRSLITGDGTTDALAFLSTNTATGSLTLENGNTLTTPSGLGGSFSNAGDITIDATGGTGTSFTTTGDYDQSAGTTTLVAGGTLGSNSLTVTIAGGTLQGSGSVNGNVSVAGTLGAGTSAAPGTLSITGSVTFNTGATYVERLDGAFPGMGFARLVVSGSETIDSGANLTGSRLTSFVPSVGSSFLVHSTTGTVTGTFVQGSSVVIGNVTFNISYASNSGVTLSVSAPTTVYVDDTWASTSTGADPADDPIGGLVFGYNALSDIQSALNQVASGGTVVVFGGSYANPVVLSKSLAAIQTALNVDTPGQALVTINGSVTLGSSAVFDMTSASLNFGSTIDDTAAGTDTLTVSGSQTVTLAAAVGGMQALNALVDQAGTTILDNGTIDTTGDQDYTGAVSVSANIADASLMAGQSIDFAPGSSLTTSNATVKLQANTAGTGSGNFSGISIDGATITSTGSGNLLLQGDGGNDLTSGSHAGVFVFGVAQIVATGSGSITLIGVGGLGTQDDFGVDIQDIGTHVTAASGTITLTGTGGSGGTTAGFNVGVDVFGGAVVKESGNAGIVLTGTGGKGNASDFGVLVSGSNTLVTSAGTVQISGMGGGNGLQVNEIGVDVSANGTVSATGSISIQGTGGQGSNADFGVNIASVVTSATAVQITGTGGGNGSAINEHGVFITTGAQVMATANGSISIIGTGTAAGGNGIELASGGVIQATGSGAISLTGTAPDNTAAITSARPATPGLIIAGSGTVTLIGDVINLATSSGNPTVTSAGAGGLVFEPNTVARPIILGGANSAGSLVYTDTDNTAIAQGGSNGFGQVTIGNGTGSGAITTANDVTFAASVTVQSPKNTSGGVTVSNSLSVGANSLTINSGSTIATIGGGSLQAGNLALVSDGDIGSASTPLAIVTGRLTADSSAGSGGQFLSETGTVQLFGNNALDAGSSTITLDSGTFELGGSLTAANVIINSATLDGGGTVSGSLQVNSGGEVSPGLANLPGPLTIGGNYTQNAGAMLDLVIAGANMAGIDYDQLAVGGTASLDGSVSVTAINGFTPAPGDTFHVLTFASNSGDFASRTGFDFGSVFFAEVFSSSGLDLDAFSSPIVVNNATDAHVNGETSLREAINIANQGSRLGLTVTIEFAANLAGQTITLAQGVLELGQGGTGTGAITIDGSSLSTPVTISGNFADRVFLIDTDMQVGINGLVIVKGLSSFAGGAIFNEGSLSLAGDIFTNNSSNDSGGAIASSGMLIVHRSSFTHNSARRVGGAVLAIDGLTVDGCTFTNNSVLSPVGAGSGGGAIAIYGGANITLSNFITNSVMMPGNPGADAAGGAIYVSSFGSTIEFNRFSGNSDAAPSHGDTVGIALHVGVNLADNWWESNTGPAANDVATGSNGSFSPEAVSDYLELTVSANPNPVMVGDSTTVTASFTTDSAGNTITAANLASLANLSAGFGGNTLPGGSITGTPTMIQNGGASATYNAGQVGGDDTVAATVDGVTASTAITVQQPPSIVSASNVTFTFAPGQSFTVMTTGFQFPTITETGEPLPVGISFHDNQDGTATISTTQQLTNSGAYVITITAHNGVGADAVQTFTLNIVGPVTFTSSAPPAFAVGMAQSFNVTTTLGQPLPTKLTEAGKLPAGVKFKPGSNGTAQLTGTPKPSTGGSYPITLTAANGVFKTTQTFYLIVNEVPKISSTASGVLFIGQPGSLAIKATGGFPFPSITTSSPLPTGVQLVDHHDGTAALVGTPAAGSNPSYTVVINAQNGNGSVSETFTLLVQSPTFQSNSATFTVGTKQSVALATNAGVPASAVVSDKGVMPKGLSFVPGKRGGPATIAGTPKAGTGGTYTIVLTATKGKSKSTQPYTVVVDQPAAFTSAASSSFSIGQTGSFTVKTNGFPFAMISASGLPSWLTLTDNHNGTATLTGEPPFGSGTSIPITLNASNGIGQAAPPQMFVLKVNESPIIITGNSATFTQNVAGTFSIQTFPNTTPKVKFTESGRLPPGLKLVDNHDGTATLKGTPAKGSKGVYTVFVTASDGVSPVAIDVLTVTVGQ
jgi:hypothetical protein